MKAVYHMHEGSLSYTWRVYHMHEGSLSYAWRQSIIYIRAVYHIH